MKTLITFLFIGFIGSSAWAIDGGYPMEGEEEYPRATAGCQPGDFVEGDLTSSVATVGLTYTPRCLRVVLGSRVTISASGFHPLAPMPGAAGNPIPRARKTVSVRFNRLGTFGYFCETHGTSDGRGMAGAIMVVRE